MNTLDKELLEIIFSGMSLNDLSNLQLVCIKFYSIINGRHFKNKYIRPKIIYILRLKDIPNLLTISCTNARFKNKYIYPRIVRMIREEYEMDKLLNLGGLYNDINLIKYAINNYNANDWDYGLYGAAEGGNKRLVNYFIRKGARSFLIARECAQFGGHEELEEYLYKLQVKYRG